ncbi:MAG: TonB-dependent receptor [Steroidobacteraceae bacterium]
MPISITAFDAETLTKANINEAKDYLQFAPNIAFTEDGQTGGRSINVSIRGVSNVNLAEATTASSIGYYIDELSVGAVSNGTINPDLQDVERVEVLRGPQGTYFGRNALGGAINITTRKPDSKFYAEGEAGFSRFSTWDIGGVVNIPVTSNFFLRAVAKHSESDGYIKNVNPLGTPDSGYKTNSFRIAARILPTDKLTVDLNVNFMDEKGGMDNSVASGVLDLDTKSIFGADFVPINQGRIGFYPANQRLVNHNHREFNNNRSLILNGRVNYEGDGFEVTSISGYIDSKTDRSFDQDNIGVDAINRLNHWKGKSYSQELRLQSTGKRTFEWTFGGIVSKDEFKAFNSITAGSEGSYTDENGNVIGLLPPIPNGFRINENNIVYTTKSFGAFAEGTYNLTDQLGLTIGGRFTEDKIDTSNFGVVAFEGAVPDASGSGKFNNFSPRRVEVQGHRQYHHLRLGCAGLQDEGVDINGGISTEVPAGEAVEL